MLFLWVPAQKTHQGCHEFLSKIFYIFILCLYLALDIVFENSGQLRKITVWHSVYGNVGIGQHFRNIDNFLNYCVRIIFNLGCQNKKTTLAVVFYWSKQNFFDFNTYLCL